MLMPGFCQKIQLHIQNPKMLTGIFNMVKSLEDDLKQIESEVSDILKKSEQSIHCISNCLNRLKEYIRQNKFQNIENEIRFFKTIKPSVYSKLIYFVKVFNIESKRPTGSDKSQKKYLINELDKLEEYFSGNLEFYQYMRNNLTFLDDKYFLRGKVDIRLYVDTFIYDADPDFSTSHDYKAAKILANDLLSIYLKSELSALERKDFASAKNMLSAKGKYVWTDSGIALTELIYSLKAARSINYGNFDIKEMAAFMEFIFKADIGDYYHEFMQMKARQNPTRYLDSLKAALLKKMSEKDEGIKQPS